MATGQSLLDRMEVLNQELQLQTGEDDVTRGLIALNMAQDAFESMIALRSNALGSAIGTVTTTASTEATAFPTGVIRIDKLQFINPATSRPAWDLENLRLVGSHSRNTFWPSNLLSSQTSGRPRGYFTNGTNIYWSPLPDATHTIRYHGFAVATDITASGTFAYPDIVMLPLAAFAVKLWKIGVEDPELNVATLATQTFTPVLDALANFNRDGAIGFEYSRSHDT